LTSARPVERGDIVLVAFPFTDLSGQKVRPALVLGNADDHDVILAFVTSRPAETSHRTNVYLDSSDDEFASTGLKVSSTIRLDKIVTLDRVLVRRRLGNIGSRTRRAVEDALRVVFHL
jgi:mRNA interferase MazF